MKKITFLVLFIIIGYILAAGCVAQKTAILEGTQTTVTIPGQSSTPLNVSIGNYNAILPVYIDNTSVGKVSPDKPLNIQVNEGHHVVKVCDGNICDQVDIEIKSAIKTSLDFGEWLSENIPRGSLIVSIGHSSTKLTVYLENTSIGEVSNGNPLNVSVNEGKYLVRVCSGSVCERQGVEITSRQQTLVDFGDRFAQSIPQSALIVSIGGYNADNLPVLIDNVTVGNVSRGKPLNLMVSDGRHSVKVCLYFVCEMEDVEIIFAKQSTIDFEDRLKKDLEFPKPTVRITYSFFSDTTFTVNVQFINPDTIDHTMTANIGCGYSYLDYNSKERKNDYAQSLVRQFVKAGNRQTQQVTLYLSKGSSVIASEPSIIDATTT